MRRSFFLVFATAVILSCNNNESQDPVLSQPAYKNINDSIAEKPSDPELYYRRGLLLYQNNEKIFAEKDFRTSWNIKPGEQTALSLATILREKSVDSAIVFLNEANRKLPESIAVMIGLARGYQKKHDTQTSLEIVNAILNKFPSQLDALLLKAELLNDTGKQAEALAALSTAYNYAPSDVDLVYEYAFALAEAKDKRTLLVADSLLQMDSSGTHAEPYYFKALYHENTGNKRQALQLLDEAIRHDYYFIDAHMEKGQILYEQKNYAAALKAFNLAATITPTFADAYFWVAKCLEATGNKTDAKLNYQRAYGLDKTMTEAKQAADRL